METLTDADFKAMINTERRFRGMRPYQMRDPKWEDALMDAFRSAYLRGYKDGQDSVELEAKLEETKNPDPLQGGTLVPGSPLPRFTGQKIFVAEMATGVVEEQLTLTEGGAWKSKGETLYQTYDIRSFVLKKDKGATRYHRTRRGWVTY